MKEKKITALGGRIWAALLAFGLIGQVAWTIENMYFNVFLYNTITGDTGMIAAMVACSAVVATVTSLVMGALSDRLGRRKAFIVGGYFLWGLSVMAFALVRVEGLEKLMAPAAAVQTAAVLVILLDCVMTFFGSTANDAAFNAWVTDVTDDTNRGRVESVLAVMPLVAMLLVFGLLDGLTAAGKWGAFFLIVGALTVLGGLLGCLFIREKADLRPSGENCAANIRYGLRPSVVLANPGLYLSLLALAVYSASQQVYMPYLIIYIQRYLGIENYALVLGVVLIAASLISVLFGRVIDKRGKLHTALPAAAVAFVGLILMFFCRGMVTVMASGTVMLGASMVLSACLQGLIRDNTPAGMAGRFQGIRILFQVMLPMVTGPWIGSAVIRGTGMTYEDLGTVKEVPTPHIFIASALVLAAIALPVWLLFRRLPHAPRALRPMLTVWGEELDRDAPLPEYPRPQLHRDSYLNLNGRWEYAICAGDDAPGEYDGEIIVPFSPESLLSGVMRTVLAGDRLWYRRQFALPEGFRQHRVLLHFGAVDQECAVFVNGQQVGGHKGGYLPFTCDITAALQPGANTLTLSVTDAGPGGDHAYGKQSFTPGGIWYTPQSGIWQTVWLESVPENYIRNLKITPLFDEKRVRIQIDADKAEGANVVVRKEGVVIAEEWADEKGEAELLVLDEYFRPWTPDDPFLYTLELTLLGGDRVDSYFGMRKFGTTEVNGKKVLALNNKPIFMNGVLDQGYWSDGLYTAASDEALIYDIQTMKDLGFNMLRKHIKIEPLRWYYHCDRLGMLVWQDMVSGGSHYNPMIIQVLPFIGIHLSDTRHRLFGRGEESSRTQFIRDMEDTVSLLYNTVSLSLWVPFNEGWGQFDSLRATQRLWELDPTRLVDHASGWHDQGGGDLKSRHVYYKPVRMRRDKHRVLALTEFGGYSMPVKGHTSGEKEFGYRIYHDRAAWMDAWIRLYEKEIIPHMERHGLSAAVYTQVSDVEDEINGLLTYDRKVCKADAERMRRLNGTLQF